MYRFQTLREQYRDALLLTFVTPLVMLGLLTAIFSMDAGQGDAPRPWGFILVFVGLTFVAALGSALCDLRTGPRMVKMSRVEVLVRAADLETRSTKALRADLEALAWAPEKRTYRSEAECAADPECEWMCGHLSDRLNRR